MNKITRWFSNPWVGAIGTILSALGIFLSIYLFVLSKKERDLTYYVHPSKSVVLKTGQASGLRVSYKDKDINSDVSAAQISIWNQGGESIRKENILDDIRILTNPRVPILETAIRNPSRDIVGFSINNDYLQNGEVSISWKILEQGDGAVIQLIYMGSVDVDISMIGTVEGQRNNPTRFVSNSRILTFGYIFNFISYTILGSYLLFSNRKPWKVVAGVFAVLISFWNLWMFISEFRNSSTMFGSPYGI